ncbi:hypothetical protein MKZ38_007015 [Zalerion maritima]|uniref:Dipeptidase n=1 Tax=Zalerion maritima TaxID=339359 RepID=A0AAD5S355_9PEZI|nr:hypothetical protein MKZ38_007015 [Zalerion maritima]
MGKEYHQPVAGGAHKQNERTARGANRSHVFRVALIVGVALLVTGFLMMKGVVPYHGNMAATTIDERVGMILSETPLIDGHDDLAILIRAVYDNHIYDDKFKVPFTEGGMPYHVDLPRLRAGKAGGAFWSVFVPCPENGTDLSDENYATSVQWTQLQIDLMNRLMDQYPSDFSGPVTSKTALAEFRAGKLISPLGIEGLHQIGNKVANLRAFYNLGVKYATLTHNCGNIYADAALWEHPFRKAPSFHGGVSEAGQLLIGEMNRIGMMVDLSHTSEETQLDVLQGKGDWHGSLAPVIFSHSSAYSLCPHPRNVKDHVLQLVKQRNSLVMVNFSPDFVSCVDNEAENGVPAFYPPNSTLSYVVDHIMHIGNLIGFEYVGIGSDFDGINSTPEGLDDVSKFPALVAELLKRGVSDLDAANVVGGNILRVWKGAEDLAKDLQEEGRTPLEDDLPHLFTDLNF